MTTPYFNNLIGAKALHLLPANDVLIIDARHSLTDFDFGKNAYSEAHIPNAHFLNMETDLSGEKQGKTVAILCQILKFSRINFVLWACAMACKWWLTMMPQVSWRLGFGGCCARSALSMWRS